MPRRRSTLSSLPADAVVLDLAAGTGKLTRQLVAPVRAGDRGRAARRHAGGVRTRRPGGRGGSGQRGRDPAPRRRGRRGLRRRGLPLVRQRRRPCARSRACCGPAASSRSSSTRSTATSSRRCRRRSGLPTGQCAIEKPPEHTVSSGLWRAPFPGPFEPFTEASYPNPVELDRDGILAQIASWSMIAALPEPDRTRLLAELGELVPDAHYRHPLRTDLYWARLR